ncbi:MAG: hypothetical protein PPP58_09915 [Natronomonas sp.]
MDLSRRDALRLGAGLTVAGVAGCVEQRVTERTTRDDSSVVWPLSPQVGGALSAPEFEAYVDRMADQYGEHGVWGRDAEESDDFETAYVSRLAAVGETPANPEGTEVSLNPDDVDPDAPLLFCDACVAVYRTDEDLYRYWLWAAADPADSRLLRDVSLAGLTVGATFPAGGTLIEGANPTVADGEATATLVGPPSATFAVRGGELDTFSARGDAGDYRLRWRGDVEETQSINAVCEEQRPGEFEFSWRIEAGYRFVDTV